MSLQSFVISQSGLPQSHFNKVHQKQQTGIESGERAASLKEVLESQNNGRPAVVEDHSLVSQQNHEGGVGYGISDSDVDVIR